MAFLVPIDRYGALTFAMFVINKTLTKIVAGRQRIPILISLTSINSFGTKEICRKMTDRRVVVNPRASAVTIVKSPKHITVHPEGIDRLKEEVCITNLSMSNCSGD